MSFFDDAREVEAIVADANRTAFDDRRQRAREAAQDSADVTQSWALGAIEVGIETATRVQITPEISGAYLAALRGERSVVSGLEAAFRAAGFEVEP